MEEMRCEECGKKLKINYARGVGVCEDEWCAAEFEMLFNDAETNGTTALGENAQVSAGDLHNKAGTKLDLYPTRDYAGNKLSPKEAKRARDLARQDRNSQREKDPMFSQLLLKIREMFGGNLAHVTRFLAEAAAKKLTPAQEATRRTLTPSDKRRLACPKTSITRKPKGIKGSSDKQNLEIMALAIASLSAKYFGTVTVNEMALMNRYGITKAQLSNAKKTILDHYRARVSQGWALPPGRILVAANRAGDLDIATENLVDVLVSRLKPAEVEVVLARYWDALTALNEPSIDGPVANVPIKMIAACVLYEIMRQLGLHESHLSAIAKALGLSGAGVKNRLEEMEKRYDRGELEEAKSLFEQSKDEAEAALDEQEEAAED